MGKCNWNKITCTLNEIVKWPRLHPKDQLTNIVFRMFREYSSNTMVYNKLPQYCRLIPSLRHNTITAVFLFFFFSKRHFVDIALLNETCRPSESIKHLTFTNKPNNPPYEVAAVMAEGRFGQGHFPKAVSGSVDRVPRLWTGRLLRLFPPGSGARARAVDLHPTAVCHLCRFQWKIQRKTPRENAPRDWLLWKSHMWFGSYVKPNRVITE